MHSGAWWAAIYGVPQSQTRLKWLSNNCSSPHPSHIIVSGLSLALAINLNAQNVKLSLKCLQILQSLRIFCHYYTALPTAHVSNPKFSPIPAGFHWTEKHPTKTHLIQRKISTLVSDHRGSPGGSVGICLPREMQEVGLHSPSRRSPGLGNATHPRILAWKIPWTAEPGRLHSIGFQSQATEHSDHSIFLFHSSADTMILVLTQVISITENNLLKWRVFVVNLLLWSYKPEKDSNKPP